MFLLGVMETMVAGISEPLCLYCQQPIERNEVCGLTLVAGLFQSDQGEQIDQQFWCHLRCFRESVGPESRWLLRPEFGGPEEV